MTVNRLHIDARKVGDDFLNLTRERPVPPSAGANEWPRIFPPQPAPAPGPLGFVSWAPTKADIDEWMASLPVIDVQPRRQHQGSASEWDDCDDCLDLYHAAQDIAAENAMTPEQWKANWDAHVKRAFWKVSR